jgi:hypothetical protein
MRGLKGHRTAGTVAAGHAFVQNVRRGHDEIATEQSRRHRLHAAFADPLPKSSQPATPRLADVLLRPCVR